MVLLFIYSSSSINSIIPAATKGLSGILLTGTTVVWINGTSSVCTSTADSGGDFCFRFELFEDLELFGWED